MLSRRPTERPKRLVLPLVLTTDTPLTSTLNISSTAALISGLVASCSTLKVTALVLSATCVAFSETMGATRTCIRRPSSNLLRNAGVGLTRLIVKPPPCGLRCYESSERPCDSCEHLLELVHGTLGDQHLLVVHQRQRVGVTRLDDEDVHQVARGEVQV